MNKSDIRQDIKKFKSYHEIAISSWIASLARISVVFFIFIVVVLAVTPWQQTTEGDGQVMALNPNDRIMTIHAMVSGQIDKWFVTDGTQVKKGDPLVQVIDVDPRFLERLESEKKAALQKYRAAIAAAETAELNLKRQEELFKQGLSSRMEYEEAKIKYKSLLAEQASAAADLAKMEVNFTRQQLQIVKAPQDGTVLRVLYASGAITVNQGDVLAIFVPDSFTPAVEVYIDGNDLPLVYPGRKARLQFEGWPAVQFSGWPSVAVGTFPGVVKVVDPSSTHKGKFRVVIVPEAGEPWPSVNFLRRGTRSHAWVLLDEVKLGYELWRQFNGFPLEMEEQPDMLTDFTRKERENSKEKEFSD